MTQVHRHDHSMTRVDVLTGVEFDEFLRAFEAAAPSFDPVALVAASTPKRARPAATAALASSVGITWTSELLTVTGVDPAGPVSVQPNSVVSWGDGVTPSSSTSISSMGARSSSTRRGRSPRACAPWR